MSGCEGQVMHSTCLSQGVFTTLPSCLVLPPKSCLFGQATFTKNKNPINSFLNPHLFFNPVLNRRKHLYYSVLVVQCVSGSISFSCHFPDTAGDTGRSKAAVFPRLRDSVPFRLRSHAFSARRLLSNWDASVHTGLSCMISGLILAPCADWSSQLLSPG